MPKKKKSGNIKVGRPPGEAQYIGESNYESYSVSQRIYNRDKFIENNLEKIDDLSCPVQDFVNWVDYSGFRNIEKISELGFKYNLHRMLIEDIVNTNHQPKYEESDEYIAVILKGFVTESDSTELKQLAVCIVLTGNSVIDMHEYPTSLLSEKTDRIKNGKGKARSKGADYLFYVLLDAYIDTYYLFFDNIRDTIIDLEDLLLEGSGKNRIDEIHEIKRRLTDVRKFLVPLFESISQLVKEESGLIREENLVYFRDLKEHLQQLVDFYNHYYDMLRDLVELNNSNINNNINQVMKVLTIIATIFIPLTFIAGIYGMNFEFMPELNYKWGYPVVLLIMFLIGIIMFLYMKRKKWF